MTNFPTLYKKTSTGKIQMWEITAEEVPHVADTVAGMITTVYGLEPGKKQIAKEWITEGKNIGKINETTPAEQAVSEATSQWEQKVKKGYVQDIEDATAGKIDTNTITGGIEPMLAHTFEKQGHKIHFPAFVQPKLDGHRCIAIIQDGVCTLWSRTRKPILSMPHIQKQLVDLYAKHASVMPGGSIVLDGELYNHDYREKFEELTSKIKQSKPMPGHEVVQYWVYDIATAPVNLGFGQRSQVLEQLKSLIGTGEYQKEAPSIIFVDTQEVENEDRMMDVFAVYMEFGFEGLMVRNANGVYKNKRSYDLQKVKVMSDAEFEIADVTSGKGKMDGKAIFNCITPEGKPFKVKMMGSLDSLAEYLDNKDKYIGRELTVKYQNLSADGIPRFPIGLRIREDI